MITMDLKLVEKLLDDADYAGLESRLADVELSALARMWPSFSPMNKLVLFKLLDASRAMEFYGKLEFKDKYYLLCGFPLQSIAPVLEKLTPLQRRHFVQLPREFYDRMFRQIASERVEISIPLRNN